MLKVIQITKWIHRPPNYPQWKVEYSRRKALCVRYVFAEDEVAAYADTVRWYNEHWRAYDATTKQV